jgi:hypothetical protein
MTAETVGGASEDAGGGAGPLSIGGADVPQGARTDLLLKVSESYTGDRLSIPLTVVNGERPGPLLFVTAAVHGDELNGIGIVRDLLNRVEPHELSRGPGLRAGRERPGGPVPQPLPAGPA